MISHDSSSRAALAVVLLAAFARSVDAQGTTTCVTHDAQGNPTAGFCNGTAITPDARFVAFSSLDDNLVAGDAHAGGYDFFVADRSTGAIELVNVSSSGVQGNGGNQPSSLNISFDGQRVVFTSDGDNLVDGDTNGVTDVFVRDRASQTLVRASVASDGTQGNNGVSGIPGRWCSISGDGRFVVFSSAATNLVANDTNGFDDVFVRDLVAGTTERVSLSSSGAQANEHSIETCISADGRFVAFTSFDRNLAPGASAGGGEIYLRDRTASTTARVSTSSTGIPGDGRASSISADGTRIAFHSFAGNLSGGPSGPGADIFVKNIVTGEVVLASVRNDGGLASSSSFEPWISPDGRCVVFQTYAWNLVPGGVGALPAAVMRDLVAGSTQCMSLTWQDLPLNAFTLSLSIAESGRQVAFITDAGNILPNYTLGDWNVFVRDRGDGTPATYCVAKVNSQGCTPKIAWVGTPSASSGLPFSIYATQVLNQKPGILFWGVAPARIPFYGGMLCVAPRLYRTSPQSSGGNPPPDDCSGQFTFDFNALIALGVSPHLAVGNEIYAQYWYRDAASSPTVGLSDAVSFVVQP